MRRNKIKACRSAHSPSSRDSRLVTLNIAAAHAPLPINFTASSSSFVCGLEMEADAGLSCKSSRPPKLAADGIEELAA